MGKAMIKCYRSKVNEENRADYVIRLSSSYVLFVGTAIIDIVQHNREMDSSAYESI